MVAGRLERAAILGVAQEIELKLALCGPEALRALQAAAERRGARAERPVRQENHFFDAADRRLGRADQVLRLRFEDGHARLSAKGPAQAASERALHVREELEVEIEPALAQRILEGACSPLEALRAALASEGELCASLRRRMGGEPFVRMGGFVNQRTRVGPLAAGGQALFLELDRTEFPGGRVDHEVELELPAPLVDAGAKLLAELLQEARVAGEPAESKAARLFALLGPGAQV